MAVPIDQGKVINNLLAKIANQEYEIAQYQVIIETLEGNDQPGGEEGVIDAEVIE